MKTAVTVKTMTGEETEESICFSNLTVSSCSPGYKEKILLPKTYSTAKIPIEKSDIPDPKMLYKWPHLKGVMKEELSNYSSDIPIGLLIGANCPPALEPYEVVPSQNGGPYAFKSRLGGVYVDQ